MIFIHAPGTCDVRDFKPHTWTDECAAGICLLTPEERAARLASYAVYPVRA